MEKDLGTCTLHPQRRRKEACGAEQASSCNTDSDHRSCLMRAKLQIIVPDLGCPQDAFLQSACWVKHRLHLEVVGQLQVD
jgi:hypothetical protein